MTTTLITGANRSLGLETTRRLIQDSNTVLTTQIDSESSLRTFAAELSQFSQTLANADPDLRRLIDIGSPAVNQVRGLIEDNRVELAALLDNLTTTGEIVVKRLPSVQQLLVLYPYVVEGGFTVAAKDPVTGLYDAHFGLVISTTTPCTNGYDPGQYRTPDERDDIPMDDDAACTDPPSVSNPRGSQNAPPRAAADYDPASVVAAYDPATKKLAWGDQKDSQLAADASVAAPASLGKESWKWLYLEPMKKGR